MCQNKWRICVDFLQQTESGESNENICGFTALRSTSAMCCRWLNERKPDMDLTGGKWSRWGAMATMHLRHIFSFGQMVTERNVVDSRLNWIVLNYLPKRKLKTNRHREIGSGEKRRDEGGSREKKNIKYGWQRTFHSGIYVQKHNICPQSTGHVLRTKRKSISK